MSSAEVLSSFSVACTSDFPSVGYQPGEKVVTIVRVCCTLVSVSIISSWCNKDIVGRYLLFFTHFIAGLSHQLAEMLLAEMVSLCWTKTTELRLIQALKFVELAGGNLLAITNVAICFNLALIVSSHHTMARVKKVTSPRLMVGFAMMSVAAALAGAFFWETVTMSGTLFWSVNLNQDQHIWVMASTFFMELIAGLAMLIMGTLLILFRRPELCQVWRLHRRIKCYIALSVIATAVDLAIGVGGVVYVVYAQYKPVLIMATWTMRHIHIALDTLVLYTALGVTATNPEHEYGRRVGADNDRRVRPPLVEDSTSDYHPRRPHHHAAPPTAGPRSKPVLCLAADGQSEGGPSVVMTTSFSPEHASQEVV